jgi:DNA-binding MarR family transcriptional regulator
MRSKTNARGDGALPTIAPRAPRISYLVKRVQHAIKVELEKHLRPFDLTAAQYAVFSIVGHRDGMTSAELARRFAVTPQTMIKLIASLEGRNLIRRKIDAENRRALKVAVTAAGQRLLQACEAEIDRMESKLFAVYAAGELRQFRELLTRLLASKQPRPSSPSVMVREGI